MEEVKQKKSTFEKFVIVLNIIAIIFMVVIIANVGIVEECTQLNESITIWQFDEVTKEQFNSQFTVYKGAIKGVKLKQLIEIVYVSNNTHPEYQVKLTDNTGKSIFTLEETDGVKIYKSTRNIESSTIYKVQIVKTDNIVSSIIVYDNIEEINEYEINNNTNNIKKENNANYKIDWDNIFLFIIIFILYIALYVFYKLDKKRILRKYNNEEEIQKRLNETKTVILFAYFIISILTILIGLFIYASNIIYADAVHKPIIYIYPEEETEVTVELGKKENLTCTYPLYEDKWEVTAKPDGTLTDKETGRTYYALYWEGINSKKYSNKLEEGFVVEGEDTIKFLEEKLEILGLNEKEAEEFIVYWLPKMQNNKYNYIRFQTLEEINENMPLEVTPEPDTLIRVMMEWKGLNKYMEVEEQQLEKAERKGYTVVEWGGTEIK